MTSTLPFSPQPLGSAHLRGQRRAYADRALSPPLEDLAFWALWHCRHARPPDAPAF